MEVERKNGKKIVFTNGCFDILHRGHLDYLKKAKKLGDILVVGINSDESVSRLKGSDRPINNQFDRSNILSELDFIDYITVFSEDTPHLLIKDIKPDVLVKGGDYKGKKVVGQEFAGKLKLIPFLKGYSTTDLIKKINSLK